MAQPRRTPARRKATPSVEPNGSDRIARRVGERVHAIRRSRGHSLDELATLTGVSKGTLSQIETGGTNPTLGVLWRIASGLGLPFSDLLGEGGQSGAVLVRRVDPGAIRSAGGELASRPLTPDRTLGNTEIYELRLAPRSTHAADPHAAGTREAVMVCAGLLRLEVGDQRYDLGPGDALSFVADVPHSYGNPGKVETRFYNVIVYERP